jgi:hypothetical protein
MWQKFDFASVCEARCDITFTAAIQITAFLYQIGQKINLSARISWCDNYLGWEREMMLSVCGGGIGN